MPRSSPVQGITSALGTEAPDGAANEASIVDQIELKLNLRFASTTARDAAITPASARKAGMRAWIDALGYWTAVLADSGSWVREDIRDVFAGTESVMLGSTPPAGTLKIREENTAVMATNGAGGFGFSFTPAFPNGIVTCVVTPGDIAGNFGYSTTILANCSLSSWNGVAYAFGSTSPCASTSIRANWTAVGW